MHIHDVPAIQKLISLNLPSTEFAVFGSGPMYANGVRKWEDLSDLDCIVIGDSWKKLTGIAVPTYNEGWNCESLSLEGGLLEFWNGWGPGEYDLGALIGNSDIIAGIRFVKLDDVVRWKREMGREKDLVHLEEIYKRFPQYLRPDASS